MTEMFFDSKYDEDLKELVKADLLSEDELIVVNHHLKGLPDMIIRRVSGKSYHQFLDIKQGVLDKIKALHDGESVELKTGDPNNNNVKQRTRFFDIRHDEELKKLKDLCHCYSKLSYCGTIISAVTGDYFYLETTYKDLKHLEPNVETIYVYL